MASLTKLRLIQFRAGYNLPVHAGDDIVGARVANLEFPLPQSVADIKRARRIGYVDIETMPRKYSLLPAAPEKPPRRQSLRDGQGAEAG